MSPPQTLALAGTVGGAGTTRLAVECAATLARDGRDAAVLDAAYATQGLADYATGRIDPDITALCLDAGALADGMVDLPADVPGRVALCPAFAPFARLAGAKSPEAARGFTDRIDEAAGWFDHVIVDTPPIAGNQAVAAVDAADRVALVTPATRRGLDAVPRAIGRLADVGVEDHLVVATRADGPVEEADATIPDSDVRNPADAPACLEDGEFTGSLVEAVETLFDVEVGIEVTEEGLREFLAG